MPGIEQLTQFVSKYQGGRYHRGAAERVTRWLQIFPLESRTAVANELANVLDKAFLTRDQAAESVRHWLQHPATVSGGLVTNWTQATFLGVQSGGGSQQDLLGVLEEQAGLLRLAPLRRNSGTKLFVYADDLSVHGMRILNDLTPWLRESAPADFDLLLLIQRQLSDQKRYIAGELTKRAKGFGNVVRVHWWSDEDFSVADCYKPTVLPEDALLQQYLVENRVVTPELRRLRGTGRYFSSPSSRDLLEREFLLAGVRVLAHNPHLSPRKYLRPLGNTVWKGLGVGVPIVTWRNCPNSAPLCLWADGEAPPLFPRAAN